MRGLTAVFQRQGALAEAEAVIREELAIIRKTSGNENRVVEALLFQLAGVLRDQNKLAEAEAAYREELAVERKLSGNESLSVANSLAEMTRFFLAQGKDAEAEPLARECLAIREKKTPHQWLTFTSQCLLGRALLGQKKFTEAEPLLLSSYEGMKQMEEKIPAGGRAWLKEALERLVQLYDATGRSEQAAEWRKKLAEFNQPAAEPRP